MAILGTSHSHLAAISSSTSYQPNDAETYSSATTNRLKSATLGLTPVTNV